MEIYNVLKKVEQKLANSNEYDLAKQKLDSEMGDLALTCIKNKRAMSISNNSEHNKNANIDLTSIKDKIVNSASSLKNTLENTPGAKTLGHGLGGMGIGSLLGSYLTSDKSEDETDEQYKNRKMESAVTGGIAGTALGASAPSVLNTIKSFINSGNQPESGISKITDSVKGSIINPTTATVAAGAAGGGALNKFLNFLDKDEIAALTGKMTSHTDFFKATGRAPTEAELQKINASIVDEINKLKGKTPLIQKIFNAPNISFKPFNVPPVNIPFKPTITQKLLPTLNKILGNSTAKLNNTLGYSAAKLTQALAHSNRGKMLLAGGGLAALLGKKMLDTSAFNESAFE
jgi:hypothetical protein